MSSSLLEYASSSNLYSVFYAYAVRQAEVSVFNAEGPPVPIPNTEVKLCSADNTRLETARKDRSMPTPVKGNSDVSLDSHLNMPT